MNERHFDDDDLRFDRLVDGELSAGEYRQLLSGLDDEPGGWRRCALAFLEAQAMGQECNSIRRTMEEPAPKISAWVESAPHRWARWLSMAASLMLMFGLGAIAEMAWRGDAVSSGPTTRLKPTIADSLAGPSISDEPIGQLQMVLANDNGDESQPFDVPLYDGRRVDPSWMSEDEAAMPPQVVQSLEQNGYQVQRHHTLVPVQLGDGSQAVVPVDGYEIVLAGHRPY